MTIQAIKDSNWLKLTPFLIVGIILSVSWITFLIGEYSAVLKHYVALVIFILNLFVYTYKFKWGLLLTGIMLLLASFNFISFFYDVSSVWISIGGDDKLRSPAINGYSFLLLIYYSIINFNFLMDEYEAYKKKHL